MANHGKKYLEATKVLGEKNMFSLQEGVKAVKDAAYARFDESVTVDVNLGIDPSKGEQVVRGSVSLPHGVGEEKKVLVFAKGDHAEQAKQAGADYVGEDDLIQRIEEGWLDFDYAVSTPDMMAKVGKVAKILGPRGLLPNKKFGTVTADVADIVKKLKKGLQFFKNDRYGLIHFKLGKCSFSDEAFAGKYCSIFQIAYSDKACGCKGKIYTENHLNIDYGAGRSC